MKTSILIGLSRHRIGVDGAGVTTLVAVRSVASIASIHKRYRLCVYGSASLPKSCSERFVKMICISGQRAGDLWRWRASPILQENSSVQKTLLRKWQALEDKHRDFAECAGGVGEGDGRCDRPLDCGHQGYKCCYLGIIAN